VDNLLGAAGMVGRLGEAINRDMKISVASEVWGPNLGAHSHCCRRGKSHGNEVTVREPRGDQKLRSQDNSCEGMGNALKER